MHLKFNIARTLQIPVQYRCDVHVLSSDVVTENVLHASVTVSSRVNVVALVSDKVFTRDSRVMSHYT